MILWDYWTKMNLHDDKSGKQRSACRDKSAVLTGGISVMLGEYRSYGKPIASVAVIFFFMDLYGLFIGTLPKIGLNILIWISFSAILFLPRTWWTRTRLWIGLCSLMIECAAGLFLYQEIKLVYFLGILIFATVVRLSLSKSPFPTMLAMFVTALLYARFGREDLFSIISFILFAIAFYFNIRSRMQRNEMYELNKRHLAELQKAYDQLEEASATAMQYAVLDERTRIAREIHDAVGHSLTSLIVQIQALRYMVHKDPVQAEGTLDGMLAEARQGLHDIRSSVYDLADDRSKSGIIPLKALLSRMETSASIRYTFRDDLDGAEVNFELYGTLFRVLQEAITNVVRHSEATQLDVSLKRQAGIYITRFRNLTALK